MAKQKTFGNDVNKIDTERVNGLLGTNNSLAYKVHETEKHFHNKEFWRGKLGVQTATAWAEDTLTSFQAISGDNDYGSDADDEAKVLGTDDTPIQSGYVKYDLHRIIIITQSQTSVYKLRIIWGTGTMADAITANQYTEVMIIANSALGFVSGGSPFDIKMPRLNCGVDKVWIQAWNATNNATIDFLAALHEYEG